ncbi:hypothetical protein NL676_033770 [Syzygium grande]|nr:hypothetical protein NL676_033770 [Syzygium grande]
MHHVWNNSQEGALMAAVLQVDVEGLRRMLSSDKVAEPRRAPLEGETLKPKCRHLFLKRLRKADDLTNNLVDN